MYCKFAFVVLTVLMGNEFVSTQQIPSSTTAAELWNPWTWFWPYAIASAEAYRDYYQKAQKATNELYQQIYNTNAFPWITGNWNGSQSNQGGNSGQNNQSGNEGSNGQANKENAKQPDQESNNEQNSQGDSQTNTEGNKPIEGTQTPAENSGAQIQGEVQDDGTADAEVNANVDAK